MNADLRGAAYSWEEAGVDVAVGVVDVAAAGLGAKYLGPIVKQGSGMLQVAAGALADGLEGVPSALLEAGMDEAIWASGDPGGAMLKVGGMALGTGAALSAGFEVAGGAYGALTGPKVKPGALDVDLDLPGSSHARAPDVDVDVGDHRTGTGPTSTRRPATCPSSTSRRTPTRKWRLEKRPTASCLRARRIMRRSLPATPTRRSTRATRRSLRYPKRPTPGSRTSARTASSTSTTHATDGWSRMRWQVSCLTRSPPTRLRHVSSSKASSETSQRSRPGCYATPRRASTSSCRARPVRWTSAPATARGRRSFRRTSWARGRWDLVVHSHPVDASGVTAGAARVPSGATGDFAWTVYQAQASGKAVVQEIHITTERGPDVTRYGYDPTSATPYSIDFPRPDGTREVRAFATIDDYHKFYNQRFGGDLGPVPDDFPGVKQADKAKADTSAAPVDEPSSDLDFDNEPTVEIPVRPEPPTTVPGTPGSPTTSGAGNVATGGMAAELTTGRPGMADLVAAKPELAARLDAAVARLDAEVHGLTAADRAAIHALFSPTIASNGGMGAGRFEQRISLLERAVSAIGDKNLDLSPAGQASTVKRLTEEGQKVLDAFDAGVTHERNGRPVRPSAGLDAEMAHLRALLAAPPEPGTNAVDVLLRLEQLQQDISRAGEILRSNGESLWEIHSPDHPAPSAVDADEVRDAIADAGGVKSMSPAAVLSATEVMDLDVSATGKIGEGLPRMGLEEIQMTPEKIGTLKTDPPELAQRLARMLDGYHRAHMVGPGFGDELTAGIMLAPSNFNLNTQNKGIERLLRGQDVVVTIQATGTRHAIPLKGGGVEHVDILTSVTYTVTRPGTGKTFVVEYRIGPPPRGAVTMIPDNIPGLTVEGLDLPED